MPAPREAENELVEELQLRVERDFSDIPKSYAEYRSDVPDKRAHSLERLLFGFGDNSDSKESIRKRLYEAPTTYYDGVTIFNQIEQQVAWERKAMRLSMRAETVVERISSSRELGILKEDDTGYWFYRVSDHGHKHPVALDSREAGGIMEVVDHLARDLLDKRALPIINGIGSIASKSAQR